MGELAESAKDRLVIFDVGAIQHDAQDQPAPKWKNRVIEDNECVVLQ